MGGLDDNHDNVEMELDWVVTDREEKQTHVNLGGFVPMDGANGSDPMDAKIK